VLFSFYAVRPALNLNLTSTIFTSNASGIWTAKTSDTPTLIDPEAPGGGDGTGTGDAGQQPTLPDGTPPVAVTNPPSSTSSGSPSDRYSATCSITFNANFGKLKMPKAYKKKWSAYFAPKPCSKTVTYGGTFGALPKARKQPKGYSFGGWWTQPTGGAQVTANSKVGITRNATLYAHWKVKVKFTAGSKSVNRQVTYGEKFGELPPCKDKTGKFEFLGWYTKKTGGKKVTAKQTVKITKPTTYYAHWRRK
jgi:hypothetical protein